MGSLDKHDLKASAAFRSPDLKLFYRDVRQSKKRDESFHIHTSRRMKI